MGPSTRVLSEEKSISGERNSLYGTNTTCGVFLMFLCFVVTVRMVHAVLGLYTLSCVGARVQREGLAPLLGPN
jgi:hypothetical protein